MPPLSSTDLEHVLDHTRELWGDLKDGRIFITGGTGFFGCWLLESFAHANETLGLNAEVTVLTRSPEEFLHRAPHMSGRKGVQFYRGDVKNFSFPEGSFSHVVHAAATASTKVSPIEMVDTVIGGTRRVLDFTVACGAKKLLFTSSGAIYGNQSDFPGPVTENYDRAPEVLDPISSYGESKRMAELLCSIYSTTHGFEAKIARCFAFIGPGLPLNEHFAAGNFIRDALSGGPIIVRGNGTPVRTYLYAADLAVWLWTILFRGQTQRAYNVGSEETITMKELAEKVAEGLGSRSEVIISLPNSLPNPGNPRTCHVPSTRRAREELGLKQMISLADAISRTAVFNRSDSLPL